MVSNVKIILCAVDLTQNAEMIMARAFEEARAHGANLHVVHINESFDIHMTMPIVSFMGEKRFSELIEEKKSETRTLIRDKLDKMVADKSSGVSESDLKYLKDVHVYEGDPVIELLNMAKKLNADLAVMGTHGKGIVEHTFLGSVAQKVTKRIKIPVLLVPAVPQP